MSSFSPLFMFGFERSGTTLLSMMMGAHPQIAVPLSPTGLWYRYGNRLDEYGELGDSQSLTRLVDDIRQEERIQMWDEQFTTDEVLEESQLGSYASVIAAFHTVYARKKGKPYWGSIDISTLYFMDRMNEWFPSAKFLHIVRDGRDVALSHETYKYGLTTTTEAAAKWSMDVRTNIKMGRMIGPSRYKVVHYEELVVDPVPTLRDLCDFLNVEFADELLEYPRMVEEKVPEDRRFLWPSLAEPPQKSKAFRWRREMSSTKRIVFERHANGMLGLLGYEELESVPISLRAYLFDFWCYLAAGGRFRRLAQKLRLAKRGEQ